MESYERTNSIRPAGVWRRHVGTGDQAQHGKSSGDRVWINWQLARDRPAVEDDGEARSTMKPGNSGGGKGPPLKGNARSDKGPRIGDEPNNSTKCSEVADGVARQSEGIAQLSLYALYDKVYRGDVLVFRPMNAARDRGAAGVDGQTLRTSKSTG